MVFLRKTRRIVLFGFIAFMAIATILNVFSNQVKLSVNRRLWGKLGPESYYMKFTEAWPYGSFLWEIYIQNGVTKWINVVPYREDDKPSWFYKETVSVEEVFKLVEEECIDRGLLKCGVDYDFWYSYPKKIDSYQWVFIDIEEFISCDKNPDECKLKIP